jgi:hypothetical protein
MFVRYIIAMTLAALAILFAIILGDYGPWYLSWFLGTGFMVLVAASAGVLFEAQEDAAKAARAPDKPLDISKPVDAPPVQSTTH